MRGKTLLLTPLFFIACGGNSGDGAMAEQDFGQKPLAALDTPCQGIAGLTGQALIAVRVDAVTTTLAALAVSGMQTSSASLQMNVTWPAAPVATCYPPYQPNGTILAQARVAIEGLTLHFQTADGQFNESVAAKAWLPVLNGRPQLPQLIAVTTRDKIQGSWQPAAEFATANTVSFVLALSASPSSGTSGNVNLSTAVPAELNAAIFRGSFAAALWPAR